MSKERLLTPKDIMERYSIKRSKVYSLLNEYDFPTIKMGKRLYVRLDDLINYENDHKF